MQVKLEAAPQYGALDVGATFHGFPVVSTVPGSPQMIVEVPDDDAAAVEQLNALVERGDVVDWREAHADYRILGWPEIVVAAVNYEVGDTFPLVGATEAVRRRGQYGAVRLGHVDTPVDADHPAFAGKQLVRATGAVPSGGEDAHGTHTLSTAASALGIASDAELYTAPALSGGSGTEAAVANGIRWCADQACRVLTLSIGGSPSQVIDAAVTYARQRGGLVFAAAGNDGGNPTPGSPARAASFIVLACDRNFQHASFTDGRNWSLPRRYYSQGVYIVAGVPGGGLGLMSGTSMATPHLAGLACLLVAAGLDEAQIAAYFDGHLAAVA
jgi:subtilisin family serine protease